TPAGTVLATAPASGPLPDEVTLTVAAAPATMDLNTLQPVERTGCSSGGNLKVDGIPGVAAVQCQIGTTWPTITRPVLSVSYDLERDADELSFKVGLTDESQLDAAATIDVVVDGNVVASPAVVFGTPVDVTISVSDALRLQFVVHSTVAGTDTVQNRTLGYVGIIEAVLTGSQAGIGKLSGTTP
ncbi:MAG: hypothetical protein JWM12_3730, partial [Ilumatobacteraceae bacterium]|nr:hypothetical protein [Ilumatobacteraceae bacterium]